MSEVSGVFGLIKISAAAKQAFYQAHGKAFISDYLCQKKLRESQQNHELESNKKQSSASPVSWLEFINAEQAHKTALQEFACAPGDLMLVNYDAENTSLFYLHFLNREWESCLESSPSLKTLLSNIAAYKDIESEDYICFSSGATNFLDSSVHCLWKVTKGKIEKYNRNNISFVPKNTANDINTAANKYYFDILDKYMQQAEESGDEDLDEEAMLKEMVVIDKDLMKYAL